MKPSMCWQRQESVWLKGVLGRASASTRVWAAAWALGLSLLLIAGPLLPTRHFLDQPASYAPLHTLLELVGMVVSALVFTLGWNLRRQPYNGAAVLLGCAALSVLLIDLAHALSYQGMPDFVTPSDPEKAINFWLAGRLVAALSLLTAAFLPFRQWPQAACRLALAASIAVAAAAWWIGLYHAAWLPRSFIPGQGLTAAKLYSEYALAALYAAAAAGFLWRVLQRGREDAVWLAAASWVLALTELFFTFYRDVSDLFNLLGHVQKVIAYGMIYRAIFAAGVVAPQKALRAREYLYHSLFQHMLNGFAYCRMLYEDDKPVDFIYLSVNPAFAVQTGLSDVVGRKVSEVIPGIQQSLPELLNIYGRVSRSGNPESFEIYVPPLGHWFSVAVYCPRPEHFVAVFDVITERKQQQARINRLMRVYAVLSSINSTIVRIHDRQALLDSACTVAVQVGQFGMAWIGLLQPDGQSLRPAASCGVDLSAVQDVPLSTGAAMPDGQGTAYEALTSKRAVYCNDLASLTQVGPVRALAIAQGYRSACILPLLVDGKGVGIMGLYAAEADFFDADEMRLLDELAADISFALQYIEREERLNYLAFYDGLTGLANRTLFLDRLHQLLRNADDSQHQVAVILLDLDRLARINESYGRHVGDALLQQVAARLQGALRAPYSLARVGADRFAVAISHLKHSADAAAVVQDQILPALGARFTVEATQLQILVRAGIALYPDDGRDAASLLRSAKAALRQAQTSGARCRYYAPEINASVAASLVMEQELRHALEAGQFVLHYQPRVDLHNGKIACAEALIRWQHPHKGLLAPGAFIGLAEECGLIVPIGAWVFDAVCAQQAAWLAAGLDIVPVSVNLSPAQFQQDHLLADMEASLRRHALAAHHLELELTESLVMHNPAAAADTMKALRSGGLRLSLDDFGTGYSSLAYLRHFPFDFLKIDRTFIRDILHNPDDAAIATAVIAMAHRLNLKVVAEGVETEEQMRYLRRYDCDQIQGYFFSPPVPAQAFGDMLRAGKCLQFGDIAAQVSGAALVADEGPGARSINS